MFQGPSSLVLDIPCLYDFIIITIKGITVEKISKVNQVIYSSSRISIPSFKAKAQTVFERFRYHHITRDKTLEKTTGPSCSKHRKLNGLIKGHFVNCFRGFHIQY